MVSTKYFLGIQTPFSVSLYFSDKKHKIRHGLNFTGQYIWTINEVVTFFLVNLDTQGESSASYNISTKTRQVYTLRLCWNMIMLEDYVVWVWIAKLLVT